MGWLYGRGGKKSVAGGEVKINKCVPRGVFIFAGAWRSGSLNARSLAFWSPRCCSSAAAALPHSSLPS